jgi:hypothetical protein
MRDTHACQVGTGAGSLRSPAVRDDKQMRATIIAATGLLACIGLAGCDNSANAPAPTAPTVQSCNCQTASVPTAQPMPPRVSHRHVRHATSYSHREYDESEAYSSYRSQSRSYDQEASESEASAEQNAWIDGYGRSHYAVTASAAPASDERTRLAPWHGYDEKCDEQK